MVTFDASIPTAIWSALTLARCSDDIAPDHARARPAHHHDRRRQRHRHPLEHRPRASRSFPRSPTCCSAASRPAASTTVTTASSRSTSSASRVTASPPSPQHDRATARQPCCSTSAPTATSGWPTPNGWPSTCPASTCCSCRTGTGTTPAASPPSLPPSPRPAPVPVAPPLIVDVHPDRPDQRGILTPLDVFAMLPPEPTIDAIEAAGGDVVTHADAHVVADLFLASGDIPRQTSYETGLPGHHTWRGDQVTLDPAHPRRALPRRQRARPGNDGVHRVLPRRRRQRRPRSTTAPPRPTGRPPARRLPPRRHRRRGPHRTDRARPRPTSSHPGSSPPDTAPAGAPPPHSPTHSARPATRPASSARATCSTPPPSAAPANVGVRRYRNIVRAPQRIARWALSLAAPATHRSAG